MIQIESVAIYGFKESIRGMRNPMNSWDRSDSGVGCTMDELGDCFNDDGISGYFETCLCSVIDYLNTAR